MRGDLGEDFSKPAILYIHGSFVPPPKEKNRDQFYLLSNHLKGYVLQPIWLPSRECIEAHFGEGSFPTYRSGEFDYVWFLTSDMRPSRKLGLLWFYITTAYKLCRSGSVDCIVCYGHSATALCGSIVKLLTGVKLIVQVTTEPARIYLTHGENISMRNRIMHVYTQFAFELTTLAADSLHLLSTRILEYYPRLLKKRIFVFPNFVQASLLDSTREKSEKYILLLGAPWYLKGADVLVKAFQLISDRFEDVSLRIVGHNPDVKELSELAGGNPRIQILAAVRPPEAAKLMSGATIFALPSRSEGVPRVVMEAMHAAVPVVASDVGGIPSLIRDGENGFLVPAEDHITLAERLATLLSDPSIRERMGQRGRAIAASEFSEAAFVLKFAEMVRNTVTNSTGSGR